MEDSVQGLFPLFSLSRDSVIAVRKGIIIFMNPAAVEKVGSDSTGKPAALILPEHILNMQANVFVASANISGKRASVSATTQSGIKLYLLNFEQEEPQEQFGTMVGAATRMLLSNIKLATTRLANLTEVYEDERLTQCTCVLEHSYSYLRRLVLNVSTIKGINRGDLPWFPVATDLKALCAGITDATAFYAEKKGISVIFDCALKSCDAVIDRELIEQMILNLLSNSLLHLSEGGTVRVTLAKAGDRIVISIDDNGTGISPEVLSTVFCRWRENATFVDSPSGAGIGLCVARGIAEKHGGALIIESKEGVGTSVRIMLPTDNMPAPIFRSKETPYNLDNMDQLLIQLSTWLPSSEYVLKMCD